MGEVQNSLEFKSIPHVDTTISAAIKSIVKSLPNGGSGTENAGYVIFLIFVAYNT